MKPVAFILFITLFACNLVAQTNITLENKNGKQKTIDVTNVLAIEFDDHVLLGDVTGYSNGQFHFKEDSLDNPGDTLIAVDVLEIKKIWLCPRKRIEKCQKWSENRDRNEVIVVMLTGALYTGGVISRNDLALYTLFTTAAGAVLTTYAIRNNPKRVRLNGKWKVVP